VTAGAVFWPFTPRACPVFGQLLITNLSTHRTTLFRRKGIGGQYGPGGTNDNVLLWSQSLFGLQGNDMGNMLLTDVRTGVTHQVGRECTNHEGDWCDVGMPESRAMIGSAVISERVLAWTQEGDAPLSLVAKDLQTSKQYVLARGGSCETPGPDSASGVEIAWSESWGARCQNARIAVAWIP
jgi:hypothetical protein